MDVTGQGLGEYIEYRIRHQKFTPLKTDSCPFITLANWGGGGGYQKSLNK